MADLSTNLLDGQAAGSTTAGKTSRSRAVSSNRTAEAWHNLAMSSSLLYCLVLDNPFDPTACKTIEDNIASAFKKTKSFDGDEMDTVASATATTMPVGVGDEMGDAAPKYSIPREYLGEVFEEGNNDDDEEESADEHDPLNLSHTSRAMSMHNLMNDADDFMTQCKKKKLDARSIFTEMVRRLAEHPAITVVWPTNMLRKDDDTGNVSINVDALCTSPDEDEVYIVLSARQSQLREFAAKKQAVFQTNPFSFSGGAGAVYNRDLELQLRRSVLSMKRHFDDDGHGSASTRDITFKPWGFRFQGPQRARLFERVIKDKFDGCGMEVDAMKQSQFLVRQLMPMHDEPKLNELHLDTWASFVPLRSFRTVLEQPLHSIVEYFGEQVGIYFFWIESYTRFLIPLAIVGLCLQVYTWITGQHNIMYACFAFLSVMWGVAWVPHWHRKESLFAEEFGTKVEMEYETARDEFEGPRAPLSDYTLMHTEFEYPLTMEVAQGNTLVQREDNALRRQMKRLFIVYPAVFVVISGLLACLYYLTVWRFDEAGNGRVENLCAAITVGLMIVFGFVFNMLADSLTSFENNRTQSEHERSLAFKMFLFSFCNAYSALFIIGLWPITDIQPALLSPKVDKYCPAGTIDHAAHNISYFNNDTSTKCHCYYYAYALDTAVGTATVDDLPTLFCRHLVNSQNNDNRLDQLSTQMMVILVFKPMLQNLQELLLPVIAAYYRLTIDSVGGTFWHLVKFLCLCRCLFCREKYEAHIDGQPLSKVTREVSDDLRKPYKLRSNAHMNSRPHRRVKLWLETQREAYLSTCDDYHEIVIQFGYMSMFAVVFPLGPLVCLLYNMLEIRIDAMKVVHVTQRSRSNIASDIGAWGPIFRILIFVSVIVNSYFVAFIGSFASEVTHEKVLSTSRRVESFMYIQYIIMVSAGIICLTRTWVPDQIKKNQIKQRVLRDRSIDLMSQKRHAEEKKQAPR